MKISYNWLKRYIPEAPEPQKLADVFTYHLCEVESVTPLLSGEGVGGEVDTIFDIKILPDRAHDLLSHQGVARELASLLDIQFIDPTSKYKIPSPSVGGGVPDGRGGLKIKIESEKCRRYIGRIVKNVKVGPSQEWVVKHLGSIGQRSINNIVDATNIVTFDCGQPCHVFDLSKVKDFKLQVRNAKKGEKITILGGSEKVLNDSMMIISDDYGNGLDIAGIKGGKYAELNKDTRDIILECANFDPTSVRKTAQALNIVTDAKKRFENDLSPELAPYAMRELSSLILEMCPDALFEDIIDIYPKKQEVKKLSFSVNKISKILGVYVSVDEIKDILRRYNFEYTPLPNHPLKGEGEEQGFEITAPSMRLDLIIEEDMAEEIGRILGYDKVIPEIPKINFQPKQNETYLKILWARNKLLTDGYSEVMNSSFCDSGEVSVLASASDKNFLRTNLTDGLKDSLKLNQANAPLLGLSEIKIFEIGTVFKKGGSSSAQDFSETKEEMYVAYADKKNITEISLNEFCINSPLLEYPLDGGGQIFPSPLQGEGLGVRSIHPGASATPQEGNHFKMWSLFPFIARDIAVWAPENVKSKEVKENIQQVIKENEEELLIKGPDLFDEFKKENQISYAFRLVFQSYDRTLTDAEVNEIMNAITEKIKENDGWQVR